MKQFLKENLAIVAAIALPLALAGVFFVSTLAVRISVPDPKHDFLVATGYASGNSQFQLDVVGEKLIVAYRPPEKNQPNGYYQYTNIPKLWRVRVPEMSVEEIALREPADKKHAEIAIPGITSVKIKNIQPGPDGYSFDSSYHYGGSIMTEIFADGSRSRYMVAVVKDGRMVPVKMTDANGYNTQFIGWIVGE